MSVSFKNHLRLGLHLELVFPPSTCPAALGPSYPFVSYFNRMKFFLLMSLLAYLLYLYLPLDGKQYVLPFNIPLKFFSHIDIYFFYRHKKRLTDKSYIQKITGFIPNTILVHTKYNAMIETFLMKRRSKFRLRKNWSPFCK